MLYHVTKNQIVCGSIGSHAIEYWRVETGRDIRVNEIANSETPAESYLISRLGTSRGISSRTRKWILALTGPMVWESAEWRSLPHSRDEGLRGCGAQTGP